MKRLALILSLLALAAFGLVACGDDDDDDAATEATTEETTTEETTTEETTTEAPPPPRPPSAESIPATIRIMVSGGVPVGGVVRETVRQGRRERIVVRSDVPDHVHVHGYDIMRDVAPGRPTQIVFRATIPGQFEVELEDRGLQIADLEVRP